MTLGLICLVKGSFESYCRHHKLWLTDEMKMSSPIFQKFLLHDMDIRIATVHQMIPLCWRNEINQSEFWSRAVKKIIWCRAILFAADKLFDAEQFYLQQRNLIWCRAILFAAERCYLPQMHFIWCSTVLFDAEKHYSQQETLFIFPAFWVTVSKSWASNLWCAVVIILL